MTVKKRLSKKANWFNKNGVTEHDENYVGIDVHKRLYHMAMWYNS